MGGTQTISQDILGCYIVTEETLRAIYNHIGEFRNEPPEVTFEFSNGRKISDKSFDDLLSDSLVKSTQLRRVRFSAPLSNRPAIDLTLKAEGSDAGNYWISGERDQAVGLADTLQNNLAGAKALYSWLSVHEYRAPSFSTAWMAFGTIVALLILGGILAGDKVIGLISDRTYFLAVALFLLAQPIYFFLLPAMVFNFGHGAKKFGFRKWAAGILFGGVTLAFVVSIGANFATDALKTLVSN
ncbi:UNVERIFIED_ORG: hypothetical protein GGI57_002328 [Rhizobium aethiopicum]